MEIRKSGDYVGDTTLILPKFETLDSGTVVEIELRGENKIWGKLY